MKRCPDCLRASDDGGESTGTRFAPGMSDVDKLEMLRFITTLPPMLSPMLSPPLPTPAQDRAMWEGFASTRPECRCEGTGYQ